MRDSELRIVFASHTATTSAFVVGSHHLSRRLQSAGHRVAHVVAPISAAHLLRFMDTYTRERFANWRGGGKVSADGVFEYVPFAFVPWQFARYLLRAGNPYLCTMPSIRSVLRRRGFNEVDVVVVDQPKMVGIERLLQPAVLVYRAVDLYAEITGDASVANAERLLVQRADLLIAMSGPILSRLREIAPDKPSLLIENGVETMHFFTPAAPPPEYAHIKRPLFVYIGALDARFDWDCVAAAAQAIPDASFVLIGPAPTPRPSRLPQNVHLFGPRAYQELPGYLQHADIAMLPTSRHEANRGRSPMKMYEYAAAGLPVVASWTEELARRSLPFVELASTERDFTDALRGLSSDSDRRARLAKIARVAAKAHDWDGLAERILAEVRRVGEGKSAARAAATT